MDCSLNTSFKWSLNSSFFCNLCFSIVTGFAKGVLHAHSYKSHFSPPLDRYNNSITVHAYTIAKASMVCFYRGLIHRPVCRPWVLGRSVNGSNLPGQVDRQQGITTRLAGETGHQCSYIL